MCGITGVVASAEGDAVDPRTVERMTRALLARGPDGEGLYADGPVGLGHRRLAIIDVEGGHQPLISVDRKIVVVVNGEFYNFQSLRKELQDAGAHFVTRSDSEVLVHGYQHWGLDVLERLEGMFAFALWDGRARELVLARDRMGEKPLYWACLPGGGLAFASELRALRVCRDVDVAIDPDALARYLVNEYVASPRSIARGVRKLAPGTLLRVRPGQAPEVRRYWDLPVPAERPSEPSVSLQESADELLTTLRRSVHERLVSDVPLGVFLSGGVDSSAVAALAAERVGPGLRTFSIGFPDRDFDESAEARLVADFIGCRHEVEFLAPGQLVGVLERIGDLLDEPLGDGSFVPTHLLSQLARRHVTVALGGDGADELFLGYPTFVAERLTRHLLDFAPVAAQRSLAQAAGALVRRMPGTSGYLPLKYKLLHFLKGLGEAGPRRHMVWLGSMSAPHALAMLTPELRAAVSPDLADTVSEHIARCPATAPWDQLAYTYCRTYLAEGILTKVDRASMAVGLEVRAPFLDRGVVECALAIHPSQRLRGLDGKHVLKHALRGVLPDHTLARKKHGFAMPIGQWLRGPLRHLIDEHLGEARLKCDGLFDPGAVQRLVREHLAGRCDHRKPLWTLIAFQSWHASFRPS